MKRAVILLSGRGTNMVALAGAGLPVEFAAVISNVPGAHGLAHAQSLGLVTRTVDHHAYPDRTAFDAALAAEIDRHEPDLVLLAGFMRVLGSAFVEGYRGRLINVHPSLLPAFPGLHTHRRALEQGVKIHGCSVHFVTPQLDHGPVIAQAAVAVRKDDTEESLAARVLEQEHRIYPQAVRWFCEERLELTPQGTVLLEHARDNESVLFSPALD